MPPVHPDLQALLQRRRAELGFGDQPMSIRAVARRAKERGHSLSPETVRRLVNGSHSGRVDDDTVAALAAALDVSRGDLLGAMHETRQQPLGRWEPPDSASRLTLRQRRAVEALIAAMVDPSVVGDDPELELVSSGADGVLMARPVDAPPMSDDDRLANEDIVSKSLDQMAEKRRQGRRFGGG